MEMIQKLLNSFVTELSVYLVQSPIFQGTLKEAVKEAVNASREGLDEHIANEVEKQIDNLNLDDEIESQVEKAFENEDIDDKVENVINNMDLEVKASNIDGLDDEIQDQVREMDLEVHASNVKDLDDMIIESIAKSKELQGELQRAVLSGLAITVDAKIDGRSIEGVTVDNAHHA